jgi:hypothetical protein
MSNYAPLHAIGARQRRLIEARLARHAGIMRQLEAGGMSHEDASRKAYAIVRLESPLQKPDAPWYPICGGAVHCDDPYKP